MADWNQQSVFHGGGEALVRRESDFSRDRLAQCLMECSLGKQRDLRPDLSQMTTPILWISGKSDARYCNIIHEMSLLNACFQSIVIPDAGHRVPWDRPLEFQQHLISFLKKI